MSALQATVRADTGSEPILERIAQGHLRTVSRCISWIENGSREADAVVDGAERLAGRAMVIGVTGIPGAGKSTLVSALARRFAETGRKAAILAVDPSSPLSGGAILGDRIRDTSSADFGVFFRSIASRGSLGGLSKSLDDVVTLLDAAGFDLILIETVGTGQSEITVTHVAHTTLAVTAPGLGDEIQAMKAGILEVCDLIVVNKCDADRRGAEIAVLILSNALQDSMRAHGLAEGGNPGAHGRPETWVAPVRAASALKAEGIEDIASLAESHREFLTATGRLDAWRSRRRTQRFHEALRDALHARVLSELGEDAALAEREVASGRITVRGGAAALAEKAIETTRRASGGRP